MLRNRSRWIIGFSLFATLLFAGPSLFIKGVSCLPPLWERTKLYPSAYMGNSEAQFEIAQSYANTKFCAQTEWSQFYWWKKAAEQDHREAAYQSGYAYETGVGIAQSFESARTWYEKAIELGSSEAAYRLGLMESWPDENQVLASVYRESAGERQFETVTELDNGKIFRDCVECPEMLVVQGSEPGQNIAVGLYEVTIADFGACILEGFCDFGRRGEAFRYLRYSPEADLPITEITIANIQDFLTWLRHKTGRNYRLLSDVEWRHLAVGKGRNYPWITEPRSACSIGNLSDGEDHPEADQEFPCYDGYTGLSPVGSFKPSPQGVYDLIGNAGEIVMDCGGRHCVTEEIIEVGGSYLSGIQSFQGNPIGKIEFSFEDQGPFYAAGFRPAITLEPQN